MADRIPLSSLSINWVPTSAQPSKRCKLSSSSSPPAPQPAPLPAPQPAPLPAPQPAPQTINLVATSAHVTGHLWQLVLALHNQQPQHPMFGERAAGKVRLPLRPVKRANEQSWELVCERLGGKVEEQMGARIPASGACWLSKVTSVQINRTSPGSSRVEVLATVIVCRLVAFLRRPCAETWDWLTEGEGTLTPFSHACNRGAQKNGDVGCINALEHGNFASKAENESHKQCGANSARALCPGHGPRRVKCIFTHEDGWPMPCRMVEDWVPKCKCARACYGARMADEEEDE